jgi:hypothetical protein
MHMSPTSKNHEFAPVWWKDKAACKTLPIDVFFPEESGNSSPRLYEKGKEFCEMCEVRPLCLAFAMHHEKDQWRRFGLFGGKSPKERLDIHAANPHKNWLKEFP